MSKLITSLLVASILGLVSTPAFADAMKPAAGTAMSKTAMAPKCPKGTTPVKSYTKKDGTVVKATCRKAPAMANKM